MGLETGSRYDTIIIGAGVAGIYQLYRTLELGMSVTVFEAGGDIGGTWYWNRYPGARFDSESYTYGYSFSKELLQDWEWSEHFAGQPETLRYLNHVVDRFDLRRHIQCNRTVRSATWDDATSEWTVELTDGIASRARFLISAMGVLSAPTLPHYEGMDSFAGPSFHTARWPHEGIDLTGKRVAVIGTGATGVQTIQEVAKVAGHLTVFQRRPNWCAPLRNAPIDAEDQARIKASYDEIFERCAQTFGGFLHTPDRRRSTEVTREERLAFWEKLYAEPGFGIWLGNFRDTQISAEANAELSEFIAGKIRSRVADPATAAKLIPTDHGFGTRRVPLETNYYEVYNQANVDLVDLGETPIEAVTPTGIRTTGAEYQFDVIVYATGFDAVTGALDRLDIVGRDGVTLRQAWSEGPRAYLGAAVVGFPNLVILLGPGAGSTGANMPRGIEQVVDWTTEMLGFLGEHGHTTFEATEEACAEWAAHVRELLDGLLMVNVRSWFMGFNTNVAGHDKPRYLIYNGGAPRFRKKCDEVAAAGYAGFDLR